jgi:para-aminobenzoate synthetase component I
MSDFQLVVRELAPRDPFTVAMALRHEPGFVFLDSSRDAEGLGRYSYVAADPFGIFSVLNGKALWNDAPLQGSAFDALETLLHQFHIPDNPSWPPFAGGAIGFIAYEAARFLETIEGFRSAQAEIPDLAFGFYDTVFVHDHLANKSVLLSSGFPETDHDGRLNRANARLQKCLEKIDQAPPVLTTNPPIEDIQSTMSRHQFEKAVNEIQERILSGDFFQANLAHRFSANLPTGYDPFSFYTDLRDLSPAPFGAYLDLCGIQIASNSPELFLRLTERQIEARPIKGTAPRDDNPEKDHELAEALRASVKDRAENTMIVDLLRNDLSRVSKPGTVNVPVLCGLETYASVHHLVSVVTSQLRDDCSGIDLIKAAFPCGSITGAPKIKAMEAIAELEAIPRGVYCGTIGALSFTGNITLNVAIRTVTFSKQTAYFHAGGGITALSNPNAEYQETLVKALRMKEAFRKSHEKDQG